ncbi:proteasome assembly chaperone 3 [Cavenderia fasciculata]|uniref:Proteasome assembly chaperone 3 n=1 Tax=Cavenderia fasciculata TaxID=261658 RepID=F4PNK2_CACFS|nr:proteasome assembly chaperone 3 [Cavenderia fasciculata]EGG23055.1 proteasome assembly chaperone 3 [Cavenderia fasciculata]|eukprot:XP_004360906.1 proteasome assembly chaperone 3 [Cavenderia fasciculata]
MSSLIIDSHVVEQEQPRQPVFPVKTKQLSVKINNVHTDISMSVFAGTVFITIAQTQRFSTWIKAIKQSEGFESDEPCYHIESLLGGNQDQLVSIYARQLIENISQRSPNSLLLSISLTDKSKEAFKAILDVIFENRIW